MNTECDEYCANHGCNQGRGCVARTEGLQKDGAFAMACIAAILAVAAVGYIALAWMLGLL